MLACSALNRRNRATLADGLPGIVFVHAATDLAVIAALEVPSGVITAAISRRLR